MSPHRTTDPAAWRTNADGSLVCPDRDLSVCPSCAAHPEVVEVAGAHYYLPADLRDEFEGLLGERDR